MADWCKYCKGPYGFFSSYYTCSITGKEESLPNNYVESYCKNNGYNCPYYKKYGPSSGGCFITTITCEILNKQDDNSVMNNLRKFRDEVLQKDDKYYDILKEYDKVGPIIASKIIDDENKEKIASVIYEDGLVTISDLVDNEKYDLAVEKYYLMTLMLINYYRLKDYYNSLKDRNLDYDDFVPEKAGHGKILVKKE